MPGSDVLRKQLELVRFEKAIDYIAANAHGAKHLNPQELAIINNMLTGTPTDANPWRQEAASVQLPSGRRETFSILTNPIFAVRDIVSAAQFRANEGEVVEAAADLYTQLVLHHFFKDANRRTAVAATYWLLRHHDIEIPALGLLETGVGDLRSPDQHQALRQLIGLTVGIAKSRKP